MSAPTPLPVPRQRASSGLDAAVATRSMHPSIPWTPGDGLKHGRASSDADAGTRCGKAGPLTMAGKDSSCCGACFPPAEEPAPAGRQCVERVHLGDPGYKVEGNRFPVSVAYRVYFDGELVGRTVGESNFPRTVAEALMPKEARDALARWSLTGGMIEGTVLTFWVAAQDVIIGTDEHGAVKRVLLFGRDIMWPAQVPIPAVSDTNPDAVVQVSMYVGRFSVGPLLEQAE